MTDPRIDFESERPDYQQLDDEEGNKLLEEETKFKHDEEWLEQMKQRKDFNDALDDWAQGD